MSPQQQPIDLDATPSESVVEFGGPPARRRRFGALGQARDLTRDRRVVPLAAALAGVAFLASLLSEWQVNQVDAAVFSEDVGERTVTAGVDDLGALGTGYLFGLFTLVACVVLALSGPPTGRRYARLVGLSVGATLLAVLVALAGTLDDKSLIVERIYDLALEGDQLVVSYGRGLWCAFAGAVLALLALYLAGRHLPAGTPAAAPAAAPGEQTWTGPAAEADPAALWSWRRPPAADAAPAPDEPLDLTVAPAQPFTSLDERDRPA